MNATPGAPDQPPPFVIRLKVVPGARRPEIVGPLADRLKLRVAAPPEHGRANREVRELLARALGIRPRDVEIVAGLTGPEKTARITGVTEQHAREHLPLP